MTQAEFMRRLETDGWDSAVGSLSFMAMCDGDKNIEALCEIYQQAYHTDDYQKTHDLYEYINWDKRFTREYEEGKKNFKPF